MKPNELRKAIGYEIKRTRKKLKMSQTELAAKIGISLATVQRIEYGVSPVPVDLFIRILAAFHEKSNEEVSA